ncbi:PaaI family thioesterase [Rhodococcus sp. IEGM 1305]|uniref:PaaI family thioesterase n=1 Tax=Rhodococcus sp. IEGM 1305 TaxID=3047092 RepID=UPI0024B7560A|nr:PaaI family thioesterase [Rhodococcus sp. IEGM 1305]MDI9953639.1 PaaI family thioesterase [Rhodococcus sp. IEGM 1305]
MTTDPTLSVPDHRPDVAAAIRALSHVLARKQVSDPDLTRRVVEQLRETTVELLALADDQRELEADLERMLSYKDGDEGMFASSSCPATGSANPFGLGATVGRDGGNVVATVTFGPASSGLPGITHGGHLCTVIDGVMGLAAVNLTGGPAVTVNLSIDFLAPVPIGEELHLTVSLSESVGRKHTFEFLGSLSTGGRPAVRGSGLFLRPRGA